MKRTVRREGVQFIVVVVRPQYSKMYNLLLSLFEVDCKYVQPAEAAAHHRTETQKNQVGVSTALRFPLEYSV